MDYKEILLDKLDAEAFIGEQVAAISSAVGDGLAVNALSGGVDSSAVTLLGHRALGDRLKTYFIDNGIMRHGEPQQIAAWFKELDVPVEVVDCQDEFFGALKGLTDPEEKREAITQTFYRDVFARLVKESGAKHLLQGTNFTDVEETIAGVKRQHNILEQLGIDTQAAFGYKVLEPIIQLRKPAVRAVGKALGLPEEIFARPPFPGPALAAQEELRDTAAFQYLAILHDDKVTGVREGRRDYGHQIEVRCWDSEDAVTGTATRLPWELLERLAERITTEVPGVVSVTYSVTTKPPSTIEAI